MKKMTPLGKNNPRSPLVSGAPVRLLRRIPGSQLIEDWKNSLGIDISGLLRGIPEILLYRCEVSQVDFFMPPEASGPPEFYEALRKFDWYYMAEKWEFTEALRDLAGQRRILEVGSGPGRFIEKAMAHLTKSTVKGIELSEAAVRKAREKNLPVEWVDVEGLIARGEIFDAVCIFQVLEHVHRPREFLEAVMKVLAPGGRLIVSVPNRDSFLRYQYNLLDMPPHHMTRWNGEVFQYLPRLLPLQLLDLRFEPLASYHIPGYVEAYGQYWRAKLPFFFRDLPEGALRRLVDLLQRKGWHRFLRGQSLYGIFRHL